MLEYEAQIRSVSFFAMLAVVGLWEILLPRKNRVASKSLRWLNNLGLVFLNALILRLMFPILAVGTALVAKQEGWGLGNNFQIPFAVQLILGVILLDLLIYGQHVIFHKVPLLWRLHRMHHIDPDLDVTSGARFHPVEIGLSMVIKMGFVWLLGIPAESVLIFELILNASAMFNHGNILIPLQVDRIVRRIIVTPDMHRVHHSVYKEETNTNYGFFLSWWDRLFKTYKEQPKEGHEKMVLGTGYFVDSKYLKLHWLLSVPFLKVRQ